MFRTRYGGSAPAFTAAFAGMVAAIAVVTMTKRPAKKPAAATKLDVATYAFATSAAAWTFMRACDAAGTMAGYPSVDGRNTVDVSIGTWMERNAVDAFAGAMPVAYAFAA